MALDKNKLGKSLGEFSENLNSERKTTSTSKNGLENMMQSASLVLGNAEGNRAINEKITALRQQQAKYNYVVQVPPRKKSNEIKQTRRLSFDITEYLYYEWQIFALEREKDGDQTNFSEFIRQALYNEFTRLKKNKNLQEWRKKRAKGKK